MMMASLLAGSEAFLVPVPCRGGSPGTSAVAGRSSTPLASQAVARCRVPGVRDLARASRTR